MKNSSDVSPSLRKELLPNYENENLKNHIMFPSTLDGAGTTSTVYLDYHRGKHDHGGFLENNKRSIFYKERLLQQQHDLGLDRDPDHQKASVKRRDYTRID